MWLVGQAQYTVLPKERTLLNKLWINAGQFELSYLQQQSSNVPDYEAENDGFSTRGTHKKGPAKRLSKRQRQRRQRLKKL